MVGDEGACGSAGCGGIQHGSLHLDKALSVKAVADLGDDEAALYKGIADLRIYDKVYEALTIAQLGILKAVELLGQGTEGLAQQFYLFGVNADLAGAGLEYLTHYAYDIADVIGLEQGIGLLAYIVPLYVYLYAALIVQYVGKAGLAHDALGHHAARNAYYLVFQLVVIVQDVNAVILLVKAYLFKGVHAGFLQGLELIAAYLQKLRKLRLGNFLFHYGDVLFCHNSLFI